MSRIWAFLTGMLCGALVLHVAMNYHVVRSNDGLHLVGKSPARLSETFVDIRAYGIADWTGHPQLAAALVESNKQHLLGDSAAATFHQSINQLLPGQTRQ